MYRHQQTSPVHATVVADAAAITADFNDSVAVAAKSQNHQPPTSDHDDQVMETSEGLACSPCLLDWSRSFHMASLIIPVFIVCCLHILSRRYIASWNSSSCQVLRSPMCSCVFRNPALARYFVHRPAGLTAVANSLSSLQRASRSRWLSRA